MPDNTSNWVKSPPRDKDESPEEIRRQRDLYLDLVDSWLIEQWKDVTPEDLQLHPESGIEIQQIIAELEQGSGSKS
jgi:hypothetical protein